MLIRRLGSILGAAGLLLALWTAGCWGRGEFDDIRPGMMPDEVERIMGHEPDKDHQIYGQGVDSDQVLWIYPQGKVLFVYWRVAQVEKAPKSKDEVFLPEKQRK
jgi:hypothetical protein